MPPHPKPLPCCPTSMADDLAFPKPGSSTNQASPPGAQVQDRAPYPVAQPPTMHWMVPTTVKGPNGTHAFREPVPTKVECSHLFKDVRGSNGSISYLLNNPHLKSNSVSGLGYKVAAAPTPHPSPGVSAPGSLAATRPCSSGCFRRLLLLTNNGNKCHFPADSSCGVSGSALTRRLTCPHAAPASPLRCMKVSAAQSGPFCALMVFLSRATLFPLTLSTAFPLTSSAFFFFN